MRRIITARQQVEMLAPWRWITATAWTPADDPGEMELQGHPSGFSASTFPGTSGHHWFVRTPSGSTVAKGKSATPEEAQAAAVQVMNDPPRPYRYGPEDLDFGRYYDRSSSNYQDPVAAVWPKGEYHGPENWLSAISWSPISGEIGHVDTKPDHQRRGLATQLFDYVKTHHRPDLHHSQTLTDDGRAWSEYEKNREASLS